MAFGDSITDGTGTTSTATTAGPTCWRAGCTRPTATIAVVNQGIGGNRWSGPATIADKPIGGGPAALARLERDIISLPGVSAVIWLEGINDFGAADTSAETVIDGYTKGVATLRQKMPGVRIFAATLTPALNSTPTHGRAEVEAKRKALNEFLRTSKIFDGVIDSRR